MTDSNQPEDRRRFLGNLAVGGGALAAFAAQSTAAQSPEKGTSFDVRAFGAAGNGERLDTRELQRAIEACARAGGGTVRFPAGTYLTGTLVLKSRVALQLESGAVLLGSTDLKDFPPHTPAFRSYTDVNYVERSLLYAEKSEQISILGQGVIDGQGGAKVFQAGHGQDGYKRRPFLIRMIECRNVTLREVTLRNSPMWVQHYLACDDVLLDGLTVESVVNANNDGIDIDCCRRVRIANCRIRSGDDAIVLKSTAPRACEQVVVTNCVLSSDCNAFKCGTESTGGFRDIAVSNCVIHDTRLAGIALESVDGGTLEGVTISNVRMARVRGGIFLRLGNRARPYLASEPGGGEGKHQPETGMAPPGVGQFRNVHIAQVSGDGADTVGCALAGLPGHPIENIRLEGVRFEFAGGGTAADTQRQIPEAEAAYPEYAMFGRLPAHGFYCRHVRNLVLDGIEVALASPDQRPAMVCDDIETLELTGWLASGSPTSAEIVLRNVRNAWIHGCRPSPTSPAFVRVEGATSQDIRFVAIARRDRQRLADQSQDVRPEAVRIDAP
jgi:polygalacturonase